MANIIGVRFKKAGKIYFFDPQYLVVKRKISFVDKADILLTKLIIRGEIRWKSKESELMTQ